MFGYWWFGTLLFLCLEIASLSARNFMRSTVPVWSHETSVKGVPLSKLTWPWYSRASYWFMDTVTLVVREVVEFHYTLFDLDTIQLLTWSVPPYLISRAADPHIHCCFYDASCHKNLKQMPSAVVRTINSLGNIGVWGFSSLAVLSSNEHTRRVARIYLIGDLAGMVLKNVIKSVEGGAGVRPGNEHFPQKKTFGGFPSGHMFEATYMVTTLGLEYGYKVGLPLSAFAGLVFGTLIGSNRHYASQVVAGGALGIVYGVAAHKLINSTDNRSLSYGVGGDGNGGVACRLGYAF